MGRPSGCGTTTWPASSRPWNAAGTEPGPCSLTRPAGSHAAPAGGHNTRVDLRHRPTERTKDDVWFPEPPAPEGRAQDGDLWPGRQRENFYELIPLRGTGPPHRQAHRLLRHRIR